MNLSVQRLASLLSLIMALLVGFPTIADENAEYDEKIGGGGDRPDVLYGEPVDRVYAPRISSWTPLDNQRFILYVTPFNPYLVTLDRRASGLMFREQVAFKFNSSTIHTKFDTIYVDGFPYGFKRIEKLDKETAKSLKAARKDKKKRKSDQKSDDQSESETESEQDSTSDDSDG